MTTMQSILAQMNSVVKNPAAAIRSFKEQTGKKVIGCFPVYTPEEIVHAAGCLPVGLWGADIRISKAHTLLPAFACPIMQANLELGLQGSYQDLSAVIIPAPCDTLKSIGQDWLYAIKDIPAWIIVYPQMRKIDAGIAYLRTEFARIRSSLETLCKVTISDQALESSIGIYNTHRQIMRKFTEIAPDYPVTITPRIRHIIIKSGFFMEKEKHSQFVSALIAHLQQQPKETSRGHRIILTGILAEPDGLLDIFAENHLKIVGDDLAQETRQFRTDVPNGTDPLMRLATQWSLIEGCSLAYDAQKKRGSMIIELARQRQADAVILCMMKFCDPEEFDYPILAKEMDEAHLPLLYLDIEQQTQSLAQARTRVQAFTETLALQK